MVDIRSQHSIDEKRSRELGKEDIGKLLLRFYLPAFAGVMVNSLHNIVDRIYIGQGVGSVALSGISIVFPIIILYTAFGMLIGSGAAVRISLNLGRGDKKRAEKVLGTAVVMVLITALLLTVAGLMLRSTVLNIYGAGQETFEYAYGYITIIMGGSTFGMLGFSLNNMIRSEGSLKVAMYSMFISAGLNIVLDPIFIFALDMGVEGAAIATVLSQIALTVWVLLHFRSKRSVIRLRLPNLRIDPGIARYIMVIGFAPFSMHIAGSVVHWLFNIQLIEYGGDIAVGAMGIINSVTIMLIMSIVSINMASQPIIGFNYGAHNYDRVLKTVRAAVRAATLISVGGWLFFLLLPETIVGAFNADDMELMKRVVTGLMLYNALLPIVGFQIVASNFFQAIGKPRQAILLTLLRQVIVLIPLLIVLPYYLGINGIWLAMPASDVVSGSVSFIFLRKEIALLKIKEKRCTPLARQRLPQPEGQYIP